MSWLDDAISFITGNKWDFVLVAIAVAFAGGGYLGWHERVLREPAILEAQRAADVAGCAKVQKVAKDQNDELTKDRDRIARDASRYRMQHPITCIVPANGGKLQPGGPEHAEVHGRSSEWYRSFADVCELYRSEVMVCSGQKDPDEQ